MRVRSRELIIKNIDAVGWGEGRKRSSIWNNTLGRTVWFADTWSLLQNNAGGGTGGGMGRTGHGLMVLGLCAECLGFPHRQVEDIFFFLFWWMLRILHNAFTFLFEGTVFMILQWFYYVHIFLCKILLDVLVIRRIFFPSICSLLECPSFPFPIIC